MSAIDWARVAVPQLDGYETDVAVALAGAGLPGFAAITPLPAGARSASAFDGAVTVAHLLAPCPYDDLDNAPLEAAGAVVAAAADRIRIWPAMFCQIQRLVRYLQPLHDPSAPDGFKSCSGCRADHAGLILATIEHPITLAEAIVHETAHLRLYALGVGIDHATRLIRNRPGELHESPVIRDRRRPMTAVFHAQFTFCHIAWLDLLMLEAEPDPALRHVLASLLAHALVRIERGAEILRDHLEVDDAGAGFVAGFSTWCDEAIARAGSVLDREHHPRAELPPAEDVPG